MATEKSNPMTPVDVGAGKLIPQGNLDPKQPGSYAYMRNALDAAQAATDKYLTRTTANPDFKPCYTTKGLEGDWQCMTNAAKLK